MEPSLEYAHSRRELMLLCSGAAFTAWLGAQSRGAVAQEQHREDSQQGKKETAEEEVTPAEDLMREHGMLRRVLLIYDHARARLGAGQDFPPEVLAAAAGIIKQFIEEYHEKLEEDYLFPRFEQAGKLAELTRVLRAQHAAGRRITGAILAAARPGALQTGSERKKMTELLEEFTRMYRPHAAREDTVLFPALHQILKEEDYKELGEKFEQIEHQKFGEEGFEKFVVQVADLEKKLGIYDLTRFTPAT